MGKCLSSQNSKEQSVDDRDIIDCWEPQRGGAPRLRPVFVALTAGSRRGAEPRSCAQFLLH